MIGNAAGGWDVQRGSGRRQILDHATESAAGKFDHPRNACWPAARNSPFHARLDTSKILGIRELHGANSVKG